MQKYITTCQQKIDTSGGRLTQLYIGTIVSDMHRNLIKGGIFMNPTFTNCPEGKLRLLYECNLFAFIAEIAEGKATDGNRRILEIQPTAIHDRTPFFIGSKLMMEGLENYMQPVLG